MEKVSFKQGEVIFKEGTYKECMYNILSGKVGIYAAYGKENEKLLTELGEGRMFGEMGLIEARMRSATAVALEDTEAELITAETFSEFMKKNPERIMAVMQNMATRLRELSKDYLDACATIAEYVKTDKSGAAKEGLLTKIKKLVTVSEEYKDEYNKIMQEQNIIYPMNEFYFYF